MHFRSFERDLDVFGHRRRIVQRSVARRDRSLLTTPELFKSLDDLVGLEVGIVVPVRRPDAHEVPAEAVASRRRSRSRALLLEWNAAPSHSMPARKRSGWSGWRTPRSMRKLETQTYISTSKPRVRSREATSSITSRSNDNVPGWTNLARESGDIMKQG